MWWVFMIISTACATGAVAAGWQAWSVRALRQCMLASAIALPLYGLSLYAAYQFIVHPASFHGANFGFGPEWQCTNMPNSEPVCIKTR